MQAIIFRLTNKNSKENCHKVNSSTNAILVSTFHLLDPPNQCRVLGIIL